MSRPTRPNERCSCLLCKPVPGRRAHPIYGYDLDRVAPIKCAICAKRIGKGPYYEEPTQARFGTMRFVHQRCETPRLKRERERIEKKWKARRAA